jgi:hypothetical protein
MMLMLMIVSKTYYFFQTRKAFRHFIIGIISYILETPVKWAFPPPMMPVFDHRHIISNHQQNWLHHQQVSQDFSERPSASSAAPLQTNKSRTKQMTNSRTIDALLTIMDDSDLRTRRRIEAAEQLLDFEAPAEAVMRAREYLVNVFENADEELADRMSAIKASRKIEAAKVSPKVVHLNRQTSTDRKAAWKEYERSKLRDAIIRETGWVPTIPNWDESFGPDYLPPEGTHWPPWWDAEGRRRR